MALSWREQAAFERITAELREDHPGLGRPERSTRARVGAALAAAVGFAAAAGGVALIGSAGPVPLAGLLLVLLGAAVVSAARRFGPGSGSPWWAVHRGARHLEHRSLGRRSPPSPKQIRREQRRRFRRQRRSQGQ